MKLLSVKSNEHSDPYEPADTIGVFTSIDKIKEVFPNKKIWEFVKEVVVPSYMDNSPSVYNGERMKERVYREIHSGKEKQFKGGSFEPYNWIEEIEVDTSLERAK